MPPSKRLINATITIALAEDVGQGDVTSLATIPAKSRATAALVARQDLVVSGMDVAGLVFKRLDPKCRLDAFVVDGQSVRAGCLLMSIQGKTRALLAAERTALNFLQRLSGIATLTASYVEAVRGTKARILDTRKTTPGMRVLEKYAVACGGGTNHRMGLHDMVLIKDNHLAALADAKPNPVAAAVARARRKYPELKVEVEADQLIQVRQAVEAKANHILLDNMKPSLLRRAVKLVAGRALAEASGGVNLDSVRAIAETGVDFISVGALTHSAPAADLALDFIS